jgi:hypothetical protein
LAVARFRDSRGVPASKRSRNRERCSINRSKVLSAVRPHCLTANGNCYVGDKTGNRGLSPVSLLFPPLFPLLFLALFLPACFRYCFPSPVSLIVRTDYCFVPGASVF